MMKRTSLILVPFALCAMGIATFFIAGCREEEKPSRPVAEPPSVYMKDPEFRKTLDAQRAKMKGYFARRAPIVEKMQKMVLDMREKLGTTDDKKVEIELKKDPQWEKLYTELTEINNLLEAVRKETTKIVGKRIAPKQVSK